MGVNFPDSPTNGQTTTVGNTTYVYNSTVGAWEILSSGGIGTMTTKGDLLSRSSSGLARVGVGTNDFVLSADSSTTSGLKWSTAPLVVANAAARPSSPYEGQVVYEIDTDRMSVWNGTAWRIFGRPTVETRFGPVSGANSTSVANTNWTLLRSGIEISIFANAGDVVEVYISYLQEGAGASNCFYRVDAGIIVGGSLVGYMGRTDGGVAAMGFMGGGYSYSDGYMTGRAMKSISSGELSNNTLTLRPYIRQFGASSTVIYHSSSEPFYFGAINHGPDLG